MKRNSRQLKILELIELESVNTQEEIARHLKEAGFIVTQATISRDIKSLGLFKYSDGDISRYTKETVGRGTHAKTSEMIPSVIQRIFDKGGNLFLEVESGCGRMVKQGLKKMVDKSVGMVCDDDMVVVYLYDEAAAIRLANKLREHF